MSRTLPIRPAGLALVLAAAGAPAAAKEHIVLVAWDADGGYRTELRIDPRKFKEVCADLDQGQRIQWAFRADSETAFNIHFHEGEKVSYPAKLEGAREEAGLLQVQATQGYCWMWRASDKPVTVAVSLRKAASR